MPISNLSKKRPGGAGGLPKRTLDEMADEFGVSKRTLVNLIRYHKGPKPYAQHNARAVRRTTWYEPAEIRTWWYNLPADVKGAPC